MAKWDNEEIKRVLGIDEITDYKTLIKQLLAEFVGTFLYLSIVLFAGLGVGNNNITIAFANGLLIASIIQIICHVSGGHLNPAVTIGNLVCGHIKLLKSVFYVLAQVLGSIVGTIVAYAVSEEGSRGDLGATIPFEALTALQVLGLEILLTFLLVAVVLSVVDASTSSRGLGSAPLAIGLSVTACHCSALTYSGSMNPVRSLGPAVVMNIWTHHWVFWAGPILGGLFAGLFYNNICIRNTRTISINE